ncbi:adenylylsulfatase HINT3 [Selaginella moellendorffii]|uniref:adenylylsulfatase HINT3 n=1 Tax=Selaginella moellendorffii TaxID=88036 RepID=UPI000D1CC975|nr:adenylylsulfatase HINT3 [Selaginella moellendorffii]XP_024518033.1 adenylylsulfatase HINT3 [Selaginella moellendorffii]|eukprot:XP_002988352.2 adenylylsulfatase HINT3 [Selaginella moellendorffii]
MAHQALPPSPPNPLEDRQNSPSAAATEWPEKANFGDSGLAKSIASSIASRSWGSPRQQQQRDWPVADDCIFCKIVHGYSPAFKLYEDDFCVCILDINPLCYGHSLLVPKGHFPALDATPPTVAAAMCSVVPLLSNAIMGATSCDSFNMVVNNGEAAGQVVFHTHFHIVPRFSGDGLWTNESVVRRPLSTFKDPTQLTLAVRSILRNNES